MKTKTIETKDIVQTRHHHTCLGKTEQPVGFRNWVIVGEYIDGTVDIVPFSLFPRSLVEGELVLQHKPKTTDKFIVCCWYVRRIDRDQLENQSDFVEQISDEDLKDILAVNRYFLTGQARELPEETRLGVPLNAFSVAAQKFIKQKHAEALLQFAELPGKEVLNHAIV
jgi:hypothetical protein